MRNRVCELSEANHLYMPQKSIPKQSFGICPYSIKNQNYVKELILYGTMAA